MTNTTSTTPPDANALHRAYISAHRGNYPNTLRYGGRVYTKEQGVGTPEYFTATRNNWLAGRRAVELVQAGQAVAI